MLNQRRLRHALIAALITFIAPLTAVAQVPEWVPKEYRDFFVRYVDDRPVWERALNEVNVTLGETGRSFALIAGVSQYPHMSGREANLRPAAVDVAKLSAYLSSEPEEFNEIVVLTEADVTAENLRYFLTNYFPQQLAKAPRSRFLFAYSGHGMTDGRGSGFLLTTEARNLEDRYHAGISLDELRVWLESAVREAHQALALINACYSASFHRMTAAFGPTGSAIPRREGAHAITAGGSDELTWHDSTFGEGSIFFEAVIAALDGRADRLSPDGVVTIDELQAYLRNTVSSFTDERQNPIAGDLLPKGSPGGFFFLDRRRQVERRVARPLSEDWWQAFGAAKSQTANLPRNQSRSDTLERNTTPTIFAAWGDRNHFQSHTGTYNSRESCESAQQKRKQDAADPNSTISEFYTCDVLPSNLYCLDMNGPLVFRSCFKDLNSCNTYRKIVDGLLKDDKDACVVLPASIAIEKLARAQY